MVGDLHFIIRSGLTGLVFLFFVIFGIWNGELWLGNSCSAAHYFTETLPGDCTAARVLHGLKDLGWLILVLVPIFGITLQGIQMMWWRYRKRDFFTDEARPHVAKRVREVFRDENIAGLQGEGPGRVQGSAKEDSG